MTTRSIQFAEPGSSYYDATASGPHRSFGDFRTASEDFYFHSSTRQTALGRLRREIRNNPYLAGLYQKFPEAVGFGEARTRSESIDFNSAADRLWYAWQKRVTVDADSLRSLQDIRLGEMLVAGEVFLIKLANGKTQLLPSEFCGSPRAEADHETGELNGVIYYPGGGVKAYRFGKMTPSGIIDYGAGTVVPAKHVIHDFRRDRAHMGRGLPWLLSSLAPARDLYEISRAKTKQIKDASKWTGTIESALGEEALAKLGASALDPDALDGLTPEERGAAAADAAPVAGTGPLRLELKDGLFLALEPGEKLNLLQTQYQAQDYKELVFILLHAISAPVGLPVELWFSGLGDVNYSGFKGLGVQWDSRRSKLKEDAREKMLEPIYYWRLDKFIAEGDLPAHPSGDFDQHDWRWARTPVLDGEKAAKENEARLRTGEKILSDIWEENGLFAEEVFAARRLAWIKLQIAAGLLDPATDPQSVIVPEIFLWRGQLPGEAAAQAPAEPEPAPVPDPELV